MTKEEFKNKYFTDNLYWVDESNYRKLQEIGLEVGCLCHTGTGDIIEWHDGFKNLGFRTYEKNNNVTVFQKEAFQLYGHPSTDFDEMLNDYEGITNIK